MKATITHSLALAAAIAATLPVVPAAAQLPFFSGAEGYGGSFSGSAPTGGWFSNATVYRVTRLDDDPGPDGKGAPGTLRGAFRENTANKIIIFDVAGTIQLNQRLDIKNLANYYVAGQTAPGPVTVYGDMTQLTHSSGKENRNVILRYLSFRKGTGDNQDSITFAGSGLGSHLILDHVSASWSEDEILSVANNNTNVTVQYSIIHDALVNNHAYGSLIRPRISSNVTFHHNLYANNASRQARFGTYNGETLTADFRNNVVYNWRDRASYAGGSSESQREFADINFVGNYFIAGPGTVSNATRSFIVDKNVTCASCIRLATSSIQTGSSTRAASPTAATPAGTISRATGGDRTGTCHADAHALRYAARHHPVGERRLLADHQPRGNWWWDRDAIDARDHERAEQSRTHPTASAPARRPPLS
jgi:pectate lyase